MEPNRIKPITALAPKKNEARAKELPEQLPSAMIPAFVRKEYEI
jgi:hypothetical protein